MIWPDNIFVQQSDTGLRFAGAKFGIKAGVNSDQSQRICDALEAVRSDYGRGTIELPDGVVNIDGPVFMQTRTMLKGQGRMATQLAVRQDIPAVRFDTSISGEAIDRAGLRDLQISYGYPNSHTASDAVILTPSSIGRIWMPQFENVQVYGAPRDAVRLEGGAENAVVEAYVRNVELSGHKRNGWWESYFTYDSDIYHLYADGLNGVAQGYGLTINGGSATVWHAHCVAHGTNDGSGNYSGGGFRLDCNNSEFGFCHADRSAGHGFVVGSYGSDPVRTNSNFWGCKGFDSGAFYPGYGANVRQGANWKIGKIDGFGWYGCQGGPHGNIANANGYGMLFEGSTTFATVVGGRFNSNAVAGLYAQAGVPDQSIMLLGVRPVGNAIDVSGQGKFVPVSSWNMARNYFILPTAGIDRTVSGNAISGNSAQMMVATGSSAEALAYINNPDLDAVCVVRRKMGDTGVLTIKHGTGNIYLKAGADFIIDSDYKQVMLAYAQDRSAWIEV